MKKKEKDSSGYRQGDKSLGPHANMRPDKFPKSQHTKDQRKDAERMLDDDNESGKARS